MAGPIRQDRSGVVTVTTLWADERLYYPLHAVPYTPARHFPKGRSDPGFATKLQIAAGLARRATQAGVDFRAVAADCAYGDQDDFRSELDGAGLLFVMALKRRRGTWAYGPDAHTPIDAARELAWHGPDRPGDWTAVTRTFRDGHTTDGSPRRRDARRAASPHRAKAQVAPLRGPSRGTVRAGSAVHLGEPGP